MKTTPAVERIEKTPGVCGGEACIRQTRIPVWLLVCFKAQGMSDEKLLEGYPGLSQEDLVAAWDYHRDHQVEIDNAIREQEDGE